MDTSPARRRHRLPRSRPALGALLVAVGVAACSETGPVDPDAIVHDTMTVVPSPPEEARALWVSRWDWYGEAELRTLLENAAGANFNIVYFQVRGRADAYYRSSLEPWAHRPPVFQLGRDPGWDPLGVALDVARARGLELHAWMNALIGWCGTEPIPETTPRHVLLEHPSWAMVDLDGGSTAENCTWLTPGEEGVRSRIAAVAADLLRHYDVDGVHLDYIRYPGPAFSYDSQSVAAYEEARTAEPALAYDDFRRGLVSATVREVRDSVRTARPGARLSAAVWGIHSDVGWSGVTLGYATRFQDSWGWTDEGIIDAIVPMIYWSIKPDYGERLDFGFLADRHADRVTNRHVYIGMGVQDAGSTFCTGCDVVRQIYRARLAGGDGVSVFSARLVESAGLWEDLRGGPFGSPVPVPSMPWLTRPDSPASLRSTPPLLDPPDDPGFAPCTGVVWERQMQWTNATGCWNGGTGRDASRGVDPLHVCTC